MNPFGYAITGLALIAFTAVFSQSVNAQVLCSTADKPFQDGVKPRLITDNLAFLEGPTWSSTNKAFYFSEMDFTKPQTHGPYARIYQLTLPDTLSVFIASSGSNGLWADSSGLYAMTHDSQSLSVFAWDNKQKTILASHIDDNAFNSPNDLVKHSKQHVFFTDPTWQLGPRESETGVTGVYRLDGETGKVSAVDLTLDKPNGITLSKDQRTLLVGAFDNTIHRYQLDENGAVVEKLSPFAQVQVPDGMTVDCQGNVYIASHHDGAVYVFSASGELLQTLKVSANTTNVAFGGEDQQTLLITSGSGLYAIRSQIPGLVRQ